jgi:hypothetical protein
MRSLNEFLEQHRVRQGVMASDSSYGMAGCFVVPHKCVALKVISSGDQCKTGWEHVSVSLPDRCPTWDEMCFVKQLFWGGDETVIQIHPRRSRYINDHPFCLHLWRPSKGGVPLPPAELIAAPNTERAIRR